MDRFIHTALNSINMVKDNSFIRSNNLANNSVPGFRSDYHLKTAGTAFIETMDSHITRGLAIKNNENNFDASSGTLNETGNEMDVSIRGDGYFITEAATGNALTRRGDFSTNQDGQLINGSNATMLGSNLQPIVIPPYRSIDFTQTGDIVIEPLNSEPGTREVVATLGLTSPTAPLKKFPDGEIRYSDGSPIVANQDATIVNKYLEMSNVNLMEELVTSIEDQRVFEINLKLVKTAEDIDRGGSSLIRMPT
ncbi:MAG: flagellar hook-basal body complex protein [Alphaproteobacteria bacterium]|jgi:flagellar basal-body rod protein FlgF|nr:flagellar hook-basal body complex protein [Alphaproteobacteria bacterium]MDG2466472.1 flagellar hook-basal body complex protein [Alphaproteobacteria bacterium]